MKHYIVETIKKKHHIKETKTSFIVAVFSEKKKAEELCNKLNKRGGFEGVSPPFFACK
jgi:hypothetical protein